MLGLPPFARLAWLVAGRVLGNEARVAKLELTLADPARAHPSAGLVDLRGYRRLAAPRASLTGCQRYLALVAHPQPITTCAAAIRRG
jgi:hypothetical protein